MGMSLDGYILGPDGGFEWSAPNEELFQFATDEIRQVGVHFLGRRLYETMVYWETVDQDPTISELELEFAALWKSLTKVVFSSTLTSVESGYHLAEGDLASEVARWRAEPAEGDIAIGGASLAMQAVDLGLVDEFGLRIHPVLVGGGTPFFPRAEHRENLELVGSRLFDTGVVCLRYRVANDAT
jgi:dihydrofolate reductase